jgi:hypothetical protein
MLGRLPVSAVNAMADAQQHTVLGHDPALD